MSSLEIIYQQYHWQASLLALLSCIAFTLLGKQVLAQIPPLKAASKVNRELARQKMSRGFYKQVQKRAAIAGAIMILFSFACVVPFFVTSHFQPLGNTLLSAFLLLMLYDFLYYLTHRFLFHGKILLRIHAVHHQQRNPCLLDANYIHPLETIIGLILYLSSVFIITLLMGRFHWLVLAIISVSYIQLNEQNHRQMNLPYFPFKYINKNSALHHIHHSGFNSGNYATLTPLFDWLFGTYDRGEKKS